MAACQESIEQKAGHHLDNAKEAFSIGNYNVAKQEIDSIKILYPKAFETRRQGIRLMQQIEEAEQMRAIEYEDSVIAVATATFEKIKAGYAFEKDERYQDIGLYTIKSQAPQRNTDRTYIRAQVDELGRMTLISSYRGSSYIHHDWLKLSVHRRPHHPTRHAPNQRTGGTIGLMLPFMSGYCRFEPFAGHRLLLHLHGSVQFSKRARGGDCHSHREGMAVIASGIIHQTSCLQRFLRQGP